MKKLLSLILAMLMLAMPVFSMAEDTELGLVKDEVKNLLSRDFTAKYVLQGQELTADMSIEATDTLFTLAQLPEDMSKTIQELLDVVAFRVTMQTTEGQAQSGVALMLSGNEAVNAKVAYADKNIYAASNLLGDKIVKLTGAQMKELAKKAIDQLVAQGKISQEMVDSAKKFVAEFRQDPAAALQKLIGEPNFEPLMNAFYGLMAGISMGEVTEAPEAFPEAKSVVTVALQKEALTNVTTELAKLIWSLPVTQKLAPMAPKGPKSEDELVALLNKVPSALAEDGELKIYLDETASNIFITMDVKMTAKGETKAISYTQLVQVLENGAHMDMQMTVDADIKVNGVMDIIATEDQASVAYHITSEAVENGVAYQPMEEIINVNAAMGETVQDISADITMRIKENADADVIGVTMKIAETETDLGDHMEGTGSLTMGLEGIGDLMTFKLAEKTDLAEAYIITEDAVEPMAMNEEELSALQGEIMQNAQTVLFGALQYLPASVLQLFMGN